MRLEAFTQRVVAGTAPSISWQQIDGDGDPANPGTVTVSISRADGTVLATDAATSGSTTDARTYALTAAQTATLDVLTATWKASGVTLATTTIDVVSAPYFGNAELRLKHPTLASDSTYPAATIAAARRDVERMIERICRRRFTPGYSLRWLPGVGRREMVLPDSDLRSVRSAALYTRPEDDPFETLVSTELAAIPPSPAGIVTRSQNSWSADWVRIGYVHGLTAPPDDIKRVAMRLTRDLLTDATTTKPDQAATWNSTDLGWSMTFVTPGVRGNHTSIPWVNEILDAWTFDEFGVG